MSLILERTTILPTDEKALAAKMFHSLVHEQAKVLFVALDKGPEAETTVQRADRVAGAAGLPDIPRWVCWARKPDHIRDVVALLVGGADLATRLDSTRGFSLSLSDEVKDEIPDSDSVPSLTRVFLSFSRAES